MSRFPKVGRLDLNDYVTICKDPNPDNLHAWVGIGPMQTPEGRLKGIGLGFGRWTFIVHSNIHKD